MNTSIPWQVWAWLRIWRSALRSAGGPRPQQRPSKPFRVDSRSRAPEYVTVVAMLAALGVTALQAADVDLTKLPLPVPRTVDFQKDVYPILKESCIGCHGPEKQKGRYRLDTHDGALKPGKEGANITAGASEKSRLIHMVAGLVEEGLMPPPSDKPGESLPLTKEQIGILRAWIDQGAKYPEGPVKEEALEYSKAIAPLLTGCVQCHGPAKAAGDFRADSRDGLLKGGKNYGASVKPGDVKSPLVTIISGKDEDIAEPEKHKLPAKAVEAITKWVMEGGK